MSSNLLSPLADLLQTTADIRELESELSAIRAGIYGTGHHSLENVFKDRVRAKVASVLEPALQETTKPESVLNELTSEIKQLPILKLRIAFEPTQATFEKIGSWLHTNTEMHWVFDLVIDQSIGAGAIIEVNGLYRDYSFKNALDQSIQKATQQLLTIN